MKCIFFTKMDQVFSLRKQQNIKRVLEKGGGEVRKSQEILLVEKNGNHDNAVALFSVIFCSRLGILAHCCLVVLAELVCCVESRWWRHLVPAVNSRGVGHRIRGLLLIHPMDL